MIDLAAPPKEHPDAVFVRRTQVRSYTSRQQFRQAGYDLAAEMFAATDPAPDARTFVLKPNVVIPRIRDRETNKLLGGDQGIVTDPDFLAGIVQRLQELGARKIIVAEGGGPTPMGPTFEDRGYARMAREMGIELADLNKETGTYGPEEINWTPVDGVVFKEIPFVRPVNDPDVVFISVPTMKTHNLGVISLCAKGLQGTIEMGYRHFCNEIQAVYGYGEKVDTRRAYQPGMVEHVERLYDMHRQDGYPRWDQEGSRYEGYAQRTCDAVAAIRSFFNIVEGIVGRDGTAFNQGKDHLSNLTLAGVNPVSVDAITSYLMGHDPTNIGYLKVAAERGLGKIDPRDIPVYLVTDDGPVGCFHIEEVGREEPGVYWRGDGSKYIYF
ncbi:MAG: DUF362 domain-containing protein [Gemmatimonadota bacterium]